MHTWQYSECKYFEYEVQDNALAQSSNNNHYSVCCARIWSLFSFPGHQILMLGWWKSVGIWRPGMRTFKNMCWCGQEDIGLYVKDVTEETFWGWLHHARRYLCIAGANTTQSGWNTDVRLDRSVWMDNEVVKGFYILLDLIRSWFNLIYCIETFIFTVQCNTSFYFLCFTLHYCRCSLWIKDK